MSDRPGGGGGADIKTERLPDDRAQAGRPPLELLVLDETGVRVHPLPSPGEVVIGRGEEADLRIDDPSVSRRHAVVRVTDGVEVEDLGSANGTLVRGCLLHEQERLALGPGDLIELGKTVCVVRGSSRAAAARKPRPTAAAASGPPVEEGPGGLVVADPAMGQLHRLLERIARGSINVLLLGETGVGKEVFAERLHAASPRAAGPLLRLNCAGFTESLLDSELFGYEKGAFTGATQAKPGLLESAHGGSVFLDEVGELPLALQAKLLRVLEDRQVRRVGAVTPRPIDVRFIAATNRDLEEEVAAGRFRADLYFRLDGFSVAIPPLRERTGEIAPLARRFVQRAAAAAGLSAPPEISSETLAYLRRYPWPGNIRELRNMMERAVLLCGGDVITPEHLPVEKMGLPPGGGEDEERARLVEALAQFHGNQTRAAAHLGISRRTLVTKMERHNLPRPRKR